MRMVGVDQCAWRGGKGDYWWLGICGHVCKPLFLVLPVPFFTSSYLFLLVPLCCYSTTNVPRHVRQNRLKLKCHPHFPFQASLNDHSTTFTAPVSTTAYALVSNRACGNADPDLSRCGLMAGQDVSFHHRDSCRLREIWPPQTRVATEILQLLAWRGLRTLSEKSHFKQLQTFLGTLLSS